MVQLVMNKNNSKNNNIRLKSLFTAFFSCRHLSNNHIFRIEEGSFSTNRELDEL